MCVRDNLAGTSLRQTITREKTTLLVHQTIIKTDHITTTIHRLTATVTIVHATATVMIVHATATKCCNMVMIKCSAATKLRRSIAMGVRVGVKIGYFLVGVIDPVRLASMA
jgi:hypothetical protein